MTSLNIFLRYRKMFQECIMLSEKYELPVKVIKKAIEEIDDFRVTTPVIGGFSTGKSSMLNAVLSNNILATQITAETSIPTEIYYGNNKVVIVNNENIEEIGIDELKDREFNSYKTKLVKVEYNHEFLKQIHEVKIVDMPGFDSGIELHNKAIDNYLPNSLAYIITISADEPVLKESIKNFLKELKLHEVPVYIVITKCDKVTSEKLEECKKFIQENVTKLLGIHNVRIACIKSKKDRNVSEVKDIFLEIQEKSLQIFEKNFSMKLKNYLTLVEKYIISRLNNKELSSSELEHKEKELEQSINQIFGKLEKEKYSFNNQLNICIDSIKAKIGSELAFSASTLETMILNGSDIKEKVNSIVRSAVMNGIKNEFEPKLQKYLKNVTELIDINVTLDTEINLDQLKVAADNLVKDIVVKSIPVVLAAIGGILGGPIGAILGGALAIFVETIFKSKQEREKRELAKQKMQGEIIPHIVEEAGKCVEIELTSYVHQINEEIHSDLEKQRDVMKKSLEDIKKQKELEEQLQRKQLDELNTDLEKVRGIANGI